MLKMKDQSVYGSHQCTAKADSTGRRCRLRSAKGRKCWHHTLRDLNLRVKKSGVPAAGMGLYSGKRPFKKGRMHQDRQHQVHELRFRHDLGGQGEQELQVLQEVQCRQPSNHANPLRQGLWHRLPGMPRRNLR